MNSPPVAFPDVYTTPEGVPLVVPAPGHLANDFDPDGDPVSWISFQFPDNGTVTGAATDGGFTYTPDPGFSGVDAFVVTITDGQGNFAQGLVSILVVPEQNRAPVAVPDVYTTPEGIPLVVAAPGHLANDTDPDGDPVSWISFQFPDNGTVTGAMPNGQFTYTPDPGFSGVDAFVVTIADGQGNFASGLVVILVGDVPVVTTCTPVFVLDDFDTTDGSEFFDITNTSTTSESLNRCTAATYNVFTARLAETFDLDGITLGPGETLRLGNPGVPDVDITFPSGTLPEPWGFGLIDNGVTSGDHVNTFVSDIVTSVIYLGEDAVYLFLHVDPALDALYCGFYAGRIAANSPEVCRVGAPVSRRSDTVETFASQLLALQASLEGTGAGVTSGEAALASSALPEAYALGESAPNPFRGSTAISFALPEASDVRLAVYDVLGREVAVLVDGSVEAGTHAASFDGRGLPSGTYLVRMTTDGGFAQTQRITLLR